MRYRGELLAGLGMAAVAAGAAILLRRPKAPLPPGVLRVIDGEIVHYVDEGEGPAIVFLHGFGGSTYSWRHLAAALSQRHRVVCLDFPGFGYSEHNARLPLGHEDHAKRVVRLMDLLGIPRAVIVGHSMGGGIAQRLAAKHPERVERLVLVASVHAGTKEPWERARRRLWGMGIAGPLMERSRRAVRRIVRPALIQMASEPEWVTDEVVEEYAAPLARPGTARALVALAHAAHEEAPADLGCIKAPVLVISGAKDIVVAPAVGHEIASAIPGAHHVVLEGAGHLMPDEEPERLQELLEAFLSGELPVEDASSSRT